MRTYLDMFSILVGLKGKKALGKKADNIRRQLVEGAGTRKIVIAITAQCRKHGGDWVYASIAQTQHVLNVPLSSARALVSEFTGRRTAPRV